MFLCIGTDILNLLNAYILSIENIQIVPRGTAAVGCKNKRSNAWVEFGELTAIDEDIASIKSHGYLSNIYNSKRSISCLHDICKVKDK